MYEHRLKPLLPRRQFYGRVVRHLCAGAGLVAGALGMGMIGYHVFEGMGWIDAFSNAAMILSGMGPLGELHTPAGKIFAGCYALFSGLAFVVVAGVALAPVIHRFFHKFHLEEQDAGKGRQK